MDHLPGRTPDNRKSPGDRDEPAGLAGLEDLDAQETDTSDVSWFDAPVFIAFWALVIVVFLQFFTRYVLNNSLSWTEEVARYLLVVVTFAGSVICARKHSHIHLDFLHAYLPRRVSRGLFVLADITTAAFFAFIAWTGITLAQRMGNQRMISLDVPRGYLFWIVVASLFAAALVSAIGIARRLRSPS